MQEQRGESRKGFTKSHNRAHISAVGHLYILNPNRDPNHAIAGNHELVPAIIHY